MKKSTKQLFDLPDAPQPRPPKILTKEELDEIYYEAEYKLQNCLRITLDVDRYVTEVKAMRGMWVPVTDYVIGLMKYLKDNQKRYYWVTNRDTTPENKRVSGPYTTSHDAGLAREIIERHSGNITYWIEELPE